MPHSGLKVAGKAALVAAGVAFGFHKGLSGGVAEAVPRQSPEPAPERVREPKPETAREAAPDTTEAPAVTKQGPPACIPSSRLEAMEVRLQSLEARVEPHTVTRQELADAVRIAAENISHDIDRRFEVHLVSVQSLRTLVAQTDELLEKVLRRLEDSGE